MFRRIALAGALLLPSIALAQASTAPQASSGVIFEFVQFADVFGSRLVAAFDSIPASRYGYRPTPPQQTVGYIAQHLENANYSLCSQVGGATHQGSAKDAVADTMKARWPKDTLVARLRASLRFCDNALEQVSAVDSPATAATLLAFETDLAEHYSQISSYMRLLGMLPPSALPPVVRTPVALPASALSAVVGEYELVPGVRLIVTNRNDALFIRNSIGGTTVRLWPASATEFFVTNVDAQLRFTRDERGAVTGLVLHQYGRDRAATKVP